MARYCLPSAPDSSKVQSLQRPLDGQCYCLESTPCSLSVDDIYYCVIFHIARGLPKTLSPTVAKVMLICEKHSLTVSVYLLATLFGHWKYFEDMKFIRVTSQSDTCLQLGRHTVTELVLLITVHRIFNVLRSI